MLSELGSFVIVPLWTEMLLASPYVIAEIPYVKIQRFPILFSLYVRSSSSNRVASFPFCTKQSTPDKPRTSDMVNTIRSGTKDISGKRTVSSGTISTTKARSDGTTTATRQRKSLWNA